MKKIIIYEDENKLNKIEEFCKIYRLDDFEKEKLIKIIEKRGKK